MKLTMDLFYKQEETNQAMENMECWKTQEHLKECRKCAPVGNWKKIEEEFKEDNGITFGGNNKSSDTYQEMYFVNKFMNLARVQKNFHKLESMEGRLDMKHIPRMMGMCYHDLITEEGWEIAKDMGKSNKLFDFKAFENLCNKKSKSIFIELLTGDISVANL